MKRILLCAALTFAFSALAGDRLLGVILVTDGGTVNNATTGYLSPGCSAQNSSAGAGACAQAFRIPAPALLSIQCRDQGAMVITNKGTVDAGDGIKLATDQFLMTSTAPTPITTSLPDGGSYTGGVVSIAPLSVAAGTARCYVFSRVGDE